MKSKRLIAVLSLLLGGVSISVLTNNSFHNANAEVSLEEDFTNNGEFTYRAGTGGTDYPVNNSISLIESGSQSASGLPSGSSGAILKVDANNGTAGFVVDYTNSHIRAARVEKITIRTYAPGFTIGTDAFRLHKGGTSWDQGYESLYTNTTSWNDIDITTSKSPFIVNSSNELGQFGIYYRIKGAVSSIYIDSITVSLLPDYEADFTYNHQFSFTPVAGTISLLSSEQVTSQGVSEGHEGAVLKITNHSSGTVSIDYSDSNIPLNIVESIKVGCYATGTTSGKKPEFRLKASNYLDRHLSEWIFVSQTDPFTGDGGYSMVSIMNTWHEFEINANTLRDGLKDLESETKPGYLGKFDIIYRCLSNSDALYIDYIELTLQENRGTVPQITTDWDWNVRIPVNSIPMINARAFDAQTNLEVPVEIQWRPLQRFDEEGRVLVKGNFEVNLTAENYYGNICCQTYRVTVGDADISAPNIDFPMNTIYLKTGTVFNFDASKYISDDYAFTYEVRYSRNMFDEWNRVLAGTYEILIIATDSSGNICARTIGVVVTDDYVDTGVIVNEDNSADIAVVEEFVTTYMLKDEISTSDHSVTEDCAEHYANAKEAFNDLTDEQKDIFNTDSQFSDMKARMEAWALANGEVFTGNGYTSASNVYRFDRNTSDNNIYLVVISISFASIALLAFLLRRKKQSK